MTNVAAKLRKDSKPPTAIQNIYPHTDKILLAFISAGIRTYNTKPSDTKNDKFD
jgi:hypothetical protein